MSQSSKTRGEGERHAVTGERRYAVWQVGEDRAPNCAEVLE